MATSAARGGAERLTLTTIVDAADELVATEGFDGLSMRKLAKACDVGVMTLYGYLRTKDDLLVAMADRALADLDLPASTAGHWTYRVAAVFHALRRALLERPELVPVVANGRVAGLAASRGSDLVFLALREAGLDELQIVGACNAMTSFTVGACQCEIGFDGRSARDFDDEFASGLDLLITGVRGWVEQT